MQSFERNYDLLRTKFPSILLNKNINETELKLENLTLILREANLVLQLK